MDMRALVETTNPAADSLTAEAFRTEGALDEAALENVAGGVNWRQAAYILSKLIYFV